MARGFAEVLSAKLAGTPQRYAIEWRTLRAAAAALGQHASGPGISSESQAALAAGADTLVYGDFSVVNGTLRATATEEDLITHRMVTVASAKAPLRGGILPVAESLARQLDGTQPFGTRNPEALRAYAAATGAPDSAAAAAGFAQAAKADPDFASAYLLWLDTALAARDRAEAERIMALARQHQGRF